MESLALFASSVMDRGTTLPDPLVLASPRRVVRVIGVKYGEDWTGSCARGDHHPSRTIDATHSRVQGRRFLVRMPRVLRYG